MVGGDKEGNELNDFGVLLRASRAIVIYMITMCRVEGRGGWEWRKGRGRGGWER